MLRTCIWIAALLTSAWIATPARSQEWARKMFEVTEHDFGSVARGSDTTYAFKFRNLYQETIHVAEVRSSCGCTTPSITQDTVPSGETSAVLAQLNTVSFLGSKSATITVVIDQPYHAEVQLSVSAYIRSDVVFDPGQVAFGSVDQGVAAEREVAIAYAGRESWKIVDVRSGNPHLEAELAQTRREAGRVDYRLLLRLTADAPAGSLADEITIVTDDGESRAISLAVTGNVVGRLEASPSLLRLGEASGDSAAAKKLLVRGQVPFTILAARATDSAIRVEVPSGEKPLHFIPVTLVGDGREREVSGTVIVQTSLGTLEVPVSGTVR